MRRPLVLGFFALIGCASAPAPVPSGEAVAISIQNLSCRECGAALQRRALEQPGILAAVFDPASVEVRLQLAAGTDPAPIVAALIAAPLEGRQLRAEVGAGHGAYAPFAPLDPGWDARELSVNGEDVPLTAVPGKVTVFDFYADWCGPCHDVDDHLHQLLARQAKLAYRRLNVVSWETPLAKHYLGSAEGLPFVVVVDRQGRELARLSGLQLDALDAAIAKASGAGQ